MNAFFCDSSSVVKRYVAESGSLWVKSLFTTLPADMIVVAAIIRRVRGGTIAAADANAACNLFLSDLNSDDNIIHVSETLLRQAATLARIYSLRGYDAVRLTAANEANHLRIAAGLPALIFSFRRH